MMVQSIADQRRAHALQFDARWAALVRGVDQLSDAHLAVLQEIVEHAPERVLLDGGNYDPQTGLWCPLALALSVPESVYAFEWFIRSNRSAKRLLTKVGTRHILAFTTNPFSGINGHAYTTERLADLRSCLRALVSFRARGGTAHERTWTRSELGDLA